MIERQMTRRQILIGAGALGAFATLMAPGTVLAIDEGKVKLLRWDLVAVVGSGVVIPGGSDVGRDRGTGDTVTLTGSGQAEPHEGTATGGGSFEHRQSDGTLVARGSYFVTAFKSFANGGGSLAGVPGLKDDVGEIDESTGGILTLGIHLVPTGGGGHDGILKVNCHLPGGNPAIEEGIELTVTGTPLDFTQDGGATLFHLLASDE